jgi:hypothetical protein
VGIASSRIGYRRAISRRAGHGVVIDDKNDISLWQGQYPSGCPPRSFNRLQWTAKKCEPVEPSQDRWFNIP